MQRPDGIVDLRKVKTIIGGEGGRNHLTWVVAYSATIEPGSERYEAIRAFGGALKPPRNFEQSVMYLPIAPPDMSLAPPPPARERSRPRARPAARARKASAKAGTKLRAHARSKPRRARSAPVKATAAKRQTVKPRTVKPRTVKARPVKARPVKARPVKARQRKAPAKPSRPAARTTPRRTRKTRR